jgi:hypothetical protein
MIVIVVVMAVIVVMFRHCVRIRPRY